MRADQMLVARGIAPTRSAAQRLIERGAVRWRAAAGWTAPRKAGDDLPEGCELQLARDNEGEAEQRSRGGERHEHRREQRLWRLVLHLVREIARHL